MLLGPHNLGRAAALAEAPAGDFRLADESGPLFCVDALLSDLLQHAFDLPQRSPTVMLPCTFIDGDRFGCYLAPNFSVFTDRQNAIRVNVPFDLPVDEQFLLELNRAFDFDIAREDVFASVICHRI
jgi:hypothetical protein